MLAPRVPAAPTDARPIHRHAPVIEARARAMRREVVTVLRRATPDQRTRLRAADPGVRGVGLVGRAATLDALCALHGPRLTAALDIVSQLARWTSGRDVGPMCRVLAAGDEPQLRALAAQAPRLASPAGSSGAMPAMVTALAAGPAAALPARVALLERRWRRLSALGAGDAGLAVKPEAALPALARGVAAGERLAWDEASTPSPRRARAAARAWAMRAGCA